MRLSEPRFWRWVRRELEREDFEMEDWVLTGGVVFMLVAVLFLLMH